jgi:hypothetical protein
MFTGKIELKKLANSEPGAKFSVFPKTVSSPLGSAVTIGELSSQSFMRQKKNLFMTSSNECISHPKVSKGKRHGQSLTESIRFKVNLEVNVSRVKNELRLRV